MTDEEATDKLAPLLDAWYRTHGSPMPWDKAVRAYGVLMKLDDKEIDRLLELDAP